MPQKQNLALAFAMKRRNKKALGGEMEPKSPMHDQLAGPKGPIMGSDSAAEAEMSRRQMMRAKAEAAGGEIESFEIPDVEDVKVDMHEPHHVEDVKVEDPEIQGEQVFKANGGMVDRIMHARSCGCSDPHCVMMSEGGMIANHMESSDDVDESMEGGFDELAKDDDLEFSYTGANSGDELGDAQEDEDRRDIVARVMRSRRLKDKMPRPA